MRAGLLLLTLLVGAGAWASTPPPVDPRIRGPLLEQLAAREGELKVGDWVTYSIRGGPQREGFWRLAVVGTDRDGEGRDGRWVELDIGTHPNMVSPVAQLRLLMSRSHPGERWQIRRMFVAHGAARPSEVEPSEVARIQRPEPSGAQRGHPGSRAVRGEPQRVMTQAGSVRAEPVDLYYRGTQVRRIWMSPDIPVVGLAKIELPGTGYIMEARDYGIGAEPMMVLPKPGTPTLSLEAIGVSPPSSPKETQP